MNQYWHNLRANTKKVPPVRLQKYLAKKTAIKEQEKPKFPGSSLLYFFCFLCYIYTKITQFSDL